MYKNVGTATQYDVEVLVEILADDSVPIWSYTEIIEHCGHPQKRLNVLRTVKTPFTSRPVGNQMQLANTAYALP